MTAIIDLDKDHYNNLVKKFWNALVYNKEENFNYINILNSNSRFVLIRVDDEIKGYCYIDYIKSDSALDYLIYICYCELRTYEEPVDYLIESNEYGDFTNDKIILKKEDMDRVQLEMEKFMKRENPNIWDAPKYLRNKERTLFRIEDNKLISDCNVITELTGLMLLMDIIKIYTIDTDNEGNIIYEFV